MTNTKQTIGTASTALRLIRGMMQSAMRTVGASSYEKAWRVGDTCAFLVRGRGGQLTALIVTPGGDGYELVADTRRVPDIADDYHNAIMRAERSRYPIN